MFEKIARGLVFVVIAVGLVGGILSGCSDNSNRTPEQITRIQHVM